MEEERNIKDLGFANGWSADSLERRLVDMTMKAGYTFQEEFTPPHTYTYTCKEAGIRYRTNCS